MVRSIDKNSSTVDGSEDWNLFAGVPTARHVFLHSQSLAGSPVLVILPPSSEQHVTMIHLVC